AHGRIRALAPAEVPRKIDLLAERPQPGGNDPSAWQRGGTVRIQQPGADGQPARGACQKAEIPARQVEPGEAVMDRAQGKLAEPESSTHARAPVGRRRRAGRACRRAELAVDPVEPEPEGEKTGSGGELERVRVAGAIPVEAIVEEVHLHPADEPQSRGVASERGAVVLMNERLAGRLRTMGKWSALDVPSHHR